MTNPFQFAGPVSLPADPTTSLGAATKQTVDSRVSYSYFTPMTAPAGMVENLRFGSYSQTVPFWAATAATTTSLRSVIAVFPVGWNAQIPAKTVSGFQFWIAAAPTLATQSGAFGVYTGNSLASLAQVGSNGAFTLATGTTGLRQVALSTSVNVSGSSFLYTAVQFSLSAPASGVGATIACTPQAQHNLAGFGGKYGEWNGTTVTPGTTLDASAAVNSSALGQIAWVSIY